MLPIFVVNSSTCTGIPVMQNCMSLLQNKQHAFALDS